MSYPHHEPTALDRLLRDYGTVWDITIDDTGLIQAAQKNVQPGGTQQTRWEWTVEALRRRLEAYEAEHGAFQAGDVS